MTARAPALRRCQAQCAPSCPRWARWGGRFCAWHANGGASDQPAPEPRRYVRGAKAAEPRKSAEAEADAAAPASSPRERAIDYAAALLSEPWCVFDLATAWHRAQQVYGLVPDARIPAELFEAEAARPPRRAVVDHEAVVRRGDD